MRRYGTLGVLALGWLVLSSAGGYAADGRLWYSGTLTDTCGAPMSETSVTIQVFEDATEDLPVADCSGSGTTDMLGRFRINLPESCEAAFASSKRLWVEARETGADPIGERQEVTPVPRALGSGVVYLEPVAAAPVQQGLGTLYYRQGENAPDAETSLLIQSDGELNSTVFADSSPVGREITVVGDVHHGTPSTLWGGNPSSLFFGSEDATLAITPNDVLPPSGDFVIEAWVYRLAGASDSANLFFQRSANETSNGARFRIYLQGSEGPILWQSAGGVALGLETQPGLLPLQQWRHLAFVRKGSFFKIFVNGHQAACASISEVPPDAGAAKAFTIGGVIPDNGTPAFMGYLNQVRVSSGTDRGYGGDGCTCASDPCFQPEQEPFAGHPAGLYFRDNQGRDYRVNMSRVNL